MRFESGGGGNPEGRGGNPEKGGSGSSDLDNQTRIRALFKLLTQDLARPGAEQKAAEVLIYILGDEEEALVFLREFRARLYA